MQNSKYFFKPLYKEELGKLKEFLSTYSDPNIKEHAVY